MFPPLVLCRASEGAGKEGAGRARGLEAHPVAGVAVGVPPAMDRIQDGHVGVPRDRTGVGDPRAVEVPRAVNLPRRVAGVWRGARRAKPADDQAAPVARAPSEERRDVAAVGAPAGEALPGPPPFATVLADPRVAAAAVVRRVAFARAVRAGEVKGPPPRVDAVGAAAEAPAVGALEGDAYEANRVDRDGPVGGPPAARRAEVDAGPEVDPYGGRVGPPPPHPRIAKGHPPSPLRVPSGVAPPDGPPARAILAAHGGKARGTAAT